MARNHPIDVLILTAADGEDTALHAVDEGAIGTWEEHELKDARWKYRVRTFARADGKTLRVAHAHAQHMGETTASAVATAFVRELKPRVLAMCGVCAGRPDWTNLGDVVVAEVLFKYDAGETVVRASGAPEEFKADGRHRDLPAPWVAHAKAFRGSFPDSDVGRRLLASRPWPIDKAELWLLKRLELGEEHGFGAAIQLSAEAWKHLVERVMEDGSVTRTAGRLDLTDRGRSRLADEWLMSRGRIEAPTWNIHVAPFATGSKLVRDTAIWNRVSEQARHVKALDMEGAAVGEVGWLVDVQPTLVVKGVMDFAEPDRRQFMRAFAAKAAAEVLVALLREHVEPRGPSARDFLQTGIIERPENHPGSLLHPSYQVVDFVDAVRSAELAELQRWCDDPTPLAARLFHGGGGAGKTRLMQEWAWRLRESGWNAGFLPKEIEADELDLVLSASGPTFVVLDYAETRVDLRSLMKRVAVRRGTERLRVVLLAREVADWWKQLIHSGESVAGLLRAHVPMRVSDVQLEGGMRASVFNVTADRFATVLGAPAPCQVPDLSDARFGRTLYIAMAALAAIEGKAVRADTILAETVARERRFWLHRFDKEIGSSIEAASEFLAGVSRLMAAVTLRGGIALGPTVDDLLKCTKAPNVPHLVAWLSNAYPRIAPASPAGIAAVEPDLIGEQLVLEVLEHHDTPANFLGHVFANVSPAEHVNGFLVLGRLGARADGQRVRHWIRRLIGNANDSVAQAALAAVLSLRSETAFAPIGPELAAALNENEGSVEFARAIEQVLPLNEPSLTMRELREWSARRQLAGLADGGGTSEQRSRLLNNLGIRLSELGRREKALEALREAAQHFRKLAKERPEVFLPDLAMSLNNLGSMLSELGQREQALEANREAVGYYRKLAKVRPEVFLPDLAMSLNNVGNMLSELGQREQALEATREAVEHRRRLAKARPEEFLPDLAKSLNNLGNMLSELGQREGALEATREAVEQYHKLTKARPEAFLPDLAMSLNNLGIRLSDMGQREQALVATREAVEHRRKLVMTHADAFLPDLAMSLNNLGSMLSELGQREQALEATREAVDHFLKLAEARPEAFVHNLAGCLNNLGIRLSRLGQREEAFEATREAVEHYRKLAEAHPEAFSPDLASSLNNLGSRLSELGKREQALEATREAVEHYRKLAKARPDAFLSDLAGCLNNLGIRLSKHGQGERALEATREAVEHYRWLSKARPDVFLPDLATSLNNLGIRLSELGHRERALEATREAVEHRRNLAKARRDVFLPYLASSLNNLGIRLGELGQREQALEATREAVEHRRELSKARPDAFLPDLASSLNNLGNILSELGQLELALETTRESVEHYKKLVKARPEAFLPDLATSLNNLGFRLSEMGQPELALEASREAVEHYRKLAKVRPESFLPDLAVSLNNLGIRLSELGYRDEAVDSALESVRTTIMLTVSRPGIHALRLRTRLSALVDRLREANRAVESNQVVGAARSLLDRLGAGESPT